MAVVFISLTGTQPLALLNPLRAIIEQHQAPDYIYLLATPHVIEKFPHMFQSMKTAPDLSSSQQTICTTSQHLKPDTEGNPPPHSLLTEILDRHKEDVIVFNMTSGLKFQIISCIQAMGNRDTLQVYAEKGGIHVFQMSKGLLVDHKVVPLPKPMNILNLQGIPYVRSNRGMNAFTRSVNQLSNQLNKFSIPTWSNIEIAGILFNLVWNDGNTLSFITRVSSQEEARNLIAVASNRHQFFELYHRNIFAFSDDTMVTERLTKDDSSHKLSVRFYENQEQLNALLARLLPDRLAPESVMLPLSPHEEENSSINIHPHGKIRKNTVLITLLAPNEVPTMLAVFSHRPEKAILFYTANNQKVCQIKDHILKNMNQLPVQELQFVPISFMAKEILNLPPFPEMNAEVNVGPGHKVAGFFLAMWAAANNGKLFSINNNTDQIEQIPDGDSLPCQGARPELILKLSGSPDNVVSCGVKENELLKKQDIYQAVLSFIDLIKDNPEAMKNFPNNPIQLQPKAEYSVSVSSKKQETATIEMSGKKTNFKITGGQWFEELVGYQFLQAGAETVSVRVRVGWGDESQRILEKRHDHQVSHRNDIDVIARFKGKYFMISCKSGEKGGVGNECELTDFHAKTVAHFGVPMVCFLKHSGAPSQNSKTGVFVFGYQTLLKPDLIRELCEKAYSARQTTRTRTD